MFPRGFAASDLIAEIAPDGWANSEMLSIFHPSPEQLHAEAIASHENLQSLRVKRDEAVEPAPTMEKVCSEFKETLCFDILRI